MWGALNAYYRCSDASTELYIIEQYHNYKMIHDWNMVEQALEIQCMVKELELLKIVVPNQFLAEDTYVCLDLIASLDVEEKARIKNGWSKGVDGQISANMIHQPQSHGKGKGK
jgi:hypothetical protein